VPRPRKLHDRYFRQAKAEGYAARSAYKLLEINRARRFLHPGDWVVDLGCAPGSWLQVAQQLVGPLGRVVGLDLAPVRIPLAPNVRTVIGDIYAIDPSVLLRTGAEIAPPQPPRMFDAVLSDMAPSTSGHGDEFLSARLCERVLDLCPQILRPGGTLLMKVLEGEPTPALLARARRMFHTAGMTKPPASRDVSRETYIFARGFGGPP
jgi:23S rRNA (uridine2552-2'-O)-methyltransferase